MIRMVDVDQHHIDYEACTTCYGIFLDAGEFKDLKSFTIADYLRGLFHKKK
jgi:Zn-finger nucleic acid-binding protein